MIRRIRLEIYYSLKTPVFWCTVFLSAIAFYIGYAPESSGDVLYLFQITMSYGIFVIVAPCIAVLPNIWRLCSYRGNILWYNQSRMGLRDYCLAQAVSSGVTGGIALSLGPTILLGYLSLKYPIAGEYFQNVYILDPAMNASFSDLIARGEFFQFFILKILLIVVYGFTANMIAFMVSAFSSDSYIIACIPFVILQLTTLWKPGQFNYYANATSYLHGNVLYHPFASTTGFVISICTIQIVIWFLCFQIQQIVMRRRVNE